MLNRILFKKIKFPLLLRGAFPHVIARERSNRSNLNHSGFSLIELMVAVTILAMVIFGIFLAFTTGFQGMAESKDRTEAVNYIQKTLEKCKDMPFKKIIDQRMTPIPGTKYSQGVIVIDTVEDSGEIKFKKVIAKVKWLDRDGINYKYEEASTTIYSTPKSGEISSPSKIVLYATPYYRIVPKSDTLLVAEILDENNNVINDWFGRITYTTYTITGGESLGFLDKDFELTNNGTSTNRFWSGINVGSVTIEASADLEGKGTVSDTVELTISTGAVAIFLEPLPGDDYLHVSDTATINLYILKADYDKNNPDFDYTGTIDLSATTGFGTLIPNSIIIGEDDDGIKTFTFTSNGESGVVGITASATDLDMGYTEIVFGDVGYAIQLSADDLLILAGENTNIEITILDDKENPTPYTGTIMLTGGPYGGGTEVIFNNSASEIINFSYLTAGPPPITIFASGGSLVGSDITITVIDAKVPSYIEIFCGGNELYIDESAQIFARIYDTNGDIVTNYNEDVQFSITSEIGLLEGDSIYKTLLAVNGITPSLNVNSYSHGPVTITADSTTSDGIPLMQGNINIDFYSLPDHMEITKSPITSSVPANGSNSAEISVTVYGEEGEITEIYDYAIHFSTNLVGSLFSNETVYPDNGVASTSISSISAGTATITAVNSSQSPYSLGTVGIPVEFVLSAPTNVEYVNGSLQSWDKEIYVTFNIEVTGSPLQLNSVEVIWTNDKLNEIAIKSPYDNPGAYDPIINTGVGGASPTSYVATGIDKLIGLGQTKIMLTFSKSQKNRSIQVIFTDDSGIPYPLEPFKIPAS